MGEPGVYDPYLDTGGKQGAVGPQGEVGKFCFLLRLLINNIILKILWNTGLFSHSLQTKDNI